MSKTFVLKLRKWTPVLMMCGLVLGLSSCFDDENPNEVKYKEWKEKNEAYLAEAEARVDENGSMYYTKIVPSWAPNAYVLVHWHNDRHQTSQNLSPMDNSTTQITYELFDVEGKSISNSFANADSIYTSRPNQNIIGMWTALTHMNVGDSVTMVMPSQAGYGEVIYAGILPYSTLIYNVKLKGISAYEVP